MSFIKIWIHCVWGTKNHLPFLTKSNKWEIINHIKSYSSDKGIFIDHINGGTEHLHCLVSLCAEQSIASVMQLIKGESSYWINKNSLTTGKFQWADEYYAVSVSESQIERVRQYIRTQESHHKLKTWDEECKEFFEKYGFLKIKG